MAGNAPEDEVISHAERIIYNSVKNGELRRFKGANIGTLSYLVKTNSVGAKKP